MNQRSTLLSHLPHPVRLGLLCCALLLAQAASQAQTPNPLMRPAIREAAMPGVPDGTPASPGMGVAGKDAAGRRIPQARPVPDGVTGQMPTMPSGTPSGLSPHASNENQARDELSQYTVVAIVDNQAVLRLNQSEGKQGPDQMNKQAGSTLPPVLRVRSGQVVTVAGAQLIPSVSPSYVDFTPSGGTVILASVSLESQGGRSGDTRENMDPAMVNRLAPARSTNSSANAAASSAGPGAGPGAQGGGGLPQGSLR